MSHTSLDCPHCKTQDCGAKIVSGGRMPEEEGEARYYFVAVCQKCGTPSLIFARQVTGRIGEGSALVRHVCRTHRDPIPNFIEPLRFIPEQALQQPSDTGLPDNVASAYGEAMVCQQRGFPALAAMGYRCTLERASRVLGGDPSRPLVARLGAVAASNGLHPSLIDWAGRLSLLQADMAVPETDPSDADIIALACFTDMLLTCAFTVPHRIGRCSAAAEAGPEAPDAQDAQERNVTALPTRPRSGATVQVRRIAQSS